MAPPEKLGQLTILAHYIQDRYGESSDCSCGNCGFRYELRDYPTDIEGGCFCEKKINQLILMNFMVVP